MAYNNESSIKFESGHRVFIRRDIFSNFWKECKDYCNSFTEKFKSVWPGVCCVSKIVGKIALFIFALFVPPIFFWWFIFKWCNNDKK